MFTPKRNINNAIWKMKQTQLYVLIALVFLQQYWAKEITINGRNVETLKVSFFRC